LLILAMSYITGTDRSQVMLLPETVDQYVDADHPVRALDAFVEGLDPVALGLAKAQPAATGRPAYAPLDLLRLLLWGYFNRVRSSRRLEVECGRNLELLWLLRGLRPDFKTIADFRRDNATALPKVFRLFVLLCKEMKLYGQELVAIDGTKLKASNHPTRQAGAEKLAQWIAQADARIAEYLNALAESESEADLLGAAIETPVAGSLRGKLKKMERYREKLSRALAAAEESGGKVPLTDPDCQSMQKVGLGYNAQIAVDAKCHLIAVAEIAKEPTDHEQLPVVAAAVEAMMGAAPAKVVADAGYHHQAALAEAEEAGVESYVPRPAKGHAATEDIFVKSDFAYEPAADGYRCVAGRLLPRNGEGFKKRGLHYQAYADAAACRVCPLKDQCTKGDYRRITRWEKEGFMEAIAERVADRPDIVRARKSLVEHPFGTIKFWWGQDAMLTRGRRNVQAELSLSAWAYNFRRVLTILGAAGLRQALQKRRKSPRSGMRRRFYRLFRSHQRLRRSPLALCRAAMDRNRIFQGSLCNAHFAPVFSHSLQTWDRGGDTNCDALWKCCAEILCHRS
jgi:transposase